MENLISGIHILAQWQVALALLVGSVGGVIIGAIPGVGAAVAIATDPIAPSNCDLWTAARLVRRMVMASAA